MGRMRTERVAGEAQPPRGVQKEGGAILKVPSFRTMIGCTAFSEASYRQQRQSGVDVMLIGTPMQFIWGMRLCIRMFSTWRDTVGGMLIRTPLLSTQGKRTKGRER